MQIMLRHQHRAQHLARTDEMMKIGARPGRADRAIARCVERSLILGMFRVADVDRPVPGEGLAVAARTRRQHAIERFDPARDRGDQIDGLDDAQPTPRIVGGKLRGTKIDHADQPLLPPTLTTPDSLTTTDAKVYNENVNS